MSTYSTTAAFGDDYVNPRGIPRMQFVSELSDFVKQLQEEFGDVSTTKRAKFRQIDISLFVDSLVRR